MGSFNLSFEHKFSADMGYLIPCMVQEVLPGDNFNHGVRLMMRVAPLANPVMHDVQVQVHHFYVQNRHVDDDFEKWIVGESENDPPKLTVGADTQLIDHMGVPPVAGLEIDARPVRGYNLVYNEFFRDQHLQVERDLDDMTLARPAWGKDYFTTCRPQPTQADQITVGFDSAFAPVVGTDQAMTAVGPNDITGGATTSFIDGRISFDSADTEGKFYSADLANMTGGIAINDLRNSVALQQFSEARAAFGSRYPDYLRYLGITPSDGRLSRPEYLGGGSAPVAFSEVLATAEGASTNVGDMYGHGIAGLRGRRYRRMFEEHGWVISVFMVRPRTVYMDGIPKQFQRFDPMDVYQKELELLPWQEVKTNEVHHAAPAGDVFGYAPRYDDYRHRQSYVSGTFRTTEKDWHMAREFTDPPTLGPSFIECNPTDRIYSDASMPDVLVNMGHQLRAKRIVGQQSALGRNKAIF